MTTKVKMTPLQVFMSAAAISSFGGLAALLRSKQPITWRSFFSAVLYSAASGITICLLWYNYVDATKNPYGLLGTCGLAGIGGVSVLDFVWQAVTKGINVKIQRDEE